MCAFFYIRLQYTVCLSNFNLNIEKTIVVLQPSSAAQLICWSNPHRFWTAGMLAPIPGSPDRPDILHPHTRLSARGEFLVCYRTLLIRTQILQIRNCRAAQDTKGSQDTASRFRLIRLRRSASHSAIAIFR
jgi:hypothetical protein